MGITCVSCGHDTVEHIDPLTDGMDDIGRCPYPHQVTRLFCGQSLSTELNDFAHLFLGLSDGKPTQCVAIETKLHKARE